MQTSQSLGLRQSQSLVMTQALQQSIKLLQMNSIELNEFIDAELEKNPFLQKEGDESGGTEADDPLPEKESAEQETASEPSADSNESYESDGSADAWEYDPAERMQVTSRGSDGEEMDIGDTKAQEISLREHLSEQAMLAFSEPLDRVVAMHLIDLVDESGYMREDVMDLALQLGTEVSHIEYVLEILQKFDPIGVCARDLSECLKIQLKEKNHLDPAMQTLLDNLPMLGNAQMDALRKRCNVDAEDLKDMIAEIRGLNPKPGNAFTHENIQAVEPDVIMKREGTGKWQVELNTNTLPKVLVNKRYYAKVSTDSKGTDKKFFSEAINTAHWLVKALDQRANTILKVSTEIAVQQDMFFRMGIHHLKPLTLKDIAKSTGFHESTISRVTTGKYMMTPRGLYELKYFFTSGLGHAKGGDDVSSETVRHLIKQMIEGEEGKHVLSDDDIADKLKEKNINVARRTVAKYRESLGIPSSMQRRRLKLVSS